MKVLLLLIAALTTPAALAEDADVAEWRPLSGEAARGFWRGWKSTGLAEGWRIEGDTLVKEGEVEDLVSKEAFGDFELALDWKVSEGGNAGIFYRGTREYDYIYWSAPEYQLLDDAKHPDGANRLTSAAAAYALYAAPAGVVKPAGEWNSARLVVDGAKVEHWLNGEKVVSYELWSPDWKAKVAASKFAPYRSYGLAKEGLIGIQGDHAGTLTLRKVRIRELP
jgi:Domain of Unknown Function (DUF1080)